jgi:amidase
VPVLLKDNIDTADMPTAAGSVALAGSLPPDDAFITRKLRNAGAIILGKGTLTEFANFLAVGMPTGYSSLGGFGFNPYDPRVDPRTEAPFNDGRPVLQTGGSSSGPGIGVNANLVAIAIGTETSGSILSPASANGVV